jgi:hypothetical protein
MFTQSMPALAQALSGALPEAALRQLMQSLGNCQQPLTHRGSVNFQPPEATGAGGLARPGAWKTSDYRDLLPNAGQDVFVDMPGYGGGGGITNTNNYDGNQFSFPINQDFNYTNYFGGDTFNVAGDSTFNNTFNNNITTSTLTTNNINATYINNTYVGQAGRDGVDGAAGAAGRDGITTVIFADGGGGGGRGGSRDTKKIITAIEDQATGFVSVPKVSGLTVKNKAVTVNTENTDVEINTKGTVSVPYVSSATTKSGSATGKVSVPTVTGASLSDAKASGTIKYDVYTKATITQITGTVPVPTEGTFKATPTGIAAECTIEGLSGSITIPVVTGGSLDADCKLNLTTKDQTFTVNFAGSPTCKVTSQGEVSGTVSLSGSKNTTVTISTPTISLTRSDGSATADLSVSGGKIDLTPGTSEKDVSISIPALGVDLTPGNQDVSVTTKGTASVLCPDGTGELTSDEVEGDSEEEDLPVFVTVKSTPDTLTYLKPN